MSPDVAVALAASRSACAVAIAASLSSCVAKHKAEFLVRPSLEESLPPHDVKIKAMARPKAESLFPLKRDNPNIDTP